MQATITDKYTQKYNPMLSVQQKAVMAPPQIDTLGASGITSCPKRR